MLEGKACDANREFRWSRVPNSQRDPREKPGDLIIERRWPIGTELGLRNQIETPCDWVARIDAVSDGKRLL